MGRSSVTELHRALLELGVILITHLPGNARAKGKIERLFRFIQERFISEHTAKTLDKLNLDDVFCLKQERKVAKDKRRIMFFNPPRVSF